MTPQKALINTDSYATFAVAVWDAEDLTERRARKKAAEGAQAPQP
jgi:hypothetical protein